MPQLSQERFEELLFAVYNIGQCVEPGDEQGEDANNGGMKAAQAIFDLIEDKSDAFVQGANIAFRLYVEAICAKDPDAYAQREVERGYQGDRCEEDNATISLPRIGSV